MIIEKTIEYKLLIAEEEGSGIVYKSDLEGEIAALLISAEVLQHKIDSAKELKKDKKVSKKYKDILGKQINEMSHALKGINSISSLLLQGYEGFINETRA